MEDERMERSGRGLLNLFLIMLVAALVAAVLWALGVFDKKPAVQPTERVMAEAPYVEPAEFDEDTDEETFAISEDEWIELVKEVKALRKRTEPTQIATACRTTSDHIHHAKSINCCACCSAIINIIVCGTFDAIIDTIIGTIIDTNIGANG